MWPTNRPTLLSFAIAGALLAIPQNGRSQQEGNPLIVVDVPFLAQSEDLCGGAAAAMVLRYWGREDVQPDDFAGLIDRVKGGISTGDLVTAIESRGATARPIKAEPEDARREVAAGRPVIALIDGGGGRLHYVVIVAWASERVLFHDPSVGPFRVISQVEFLRKWKATGGFALVVTPGMVAPKSPSPPRPLSSSRKASECDPLVDHAVEVARGAEPEQAIPELLAASEMCPTDARALGALAGVRFKQQRWNDAAAFARQATDRDPSDTETWNLLGASLYLADEPRPALKAWNRANEPRLDRVVIEGLVRTRQDIATAAIGLRPRDLLTPDSIARAERRLEQLPTAAGGKVTYRPLAGGRADVVVSVGETGLIEPRLILVLRVFAETLAKRESRIRLNSPTGRGEGLEIGGRFASRRPAAWAVLDTPRLLGLPGVTSLTALWDRQTYRLGETSNAPTLVETRRRGALDWSHWPSASTRLDLGVGLDRFDGEGSYASVRGGVEARLGGDRLAVLTEASSFSGLGSARGFTEFGGALAFRSQVRPRRVTFMARVNGRRASHEAPLAVWPGAGTGPGRPFLLRATRLIRDGELTGEAFGRGLLHGTVEVEARVADRDLVRLGLAVFADWAKPWDSDRGPGAGRSLFAVGAGVRIHALTSALRVDVAKRPGERGVVVSAGVIPPWPR